MFANFASASVVIAGLVGYYAIRNRRQGLTLEPETVTLFEKYCNIKDEKEILKRVERARSKGIETKSYRCIQEYRFMFPRILKHPRYKQVISTIEEDSFVLDIGCCMGTDIRQMITDGVAPENLIGVDIENTFIELGFDLFNDKERLHEYFHVLDIFSKKTWPDIFHMQLFNIIYSGSVVHLLDEEQSKQFVAIVKDLLVDGGIFFGRMVGSQVEFAPKDSGSKTPQLRYIHSVESFRKTLEQYKFKNIQIELGESELDRSKTRVSHFPRDIGVITFYAQK